MRSSIGRYFRLWGALARYSLTRELAFRSNFLVKVFVELLWLTILRDNISGQILFMGRVVQPA